MQPLHAVQPWLTQVWPAPHAEHEAPALPQAESPVPGWQVPVPSRQPVQPPAHDPALQLWPAEQVAHTAPPVPHAEFEVPSWQVPFESRHPLHELLTQCPPEQTWPLPHTWHADPPVPHALVEVAMVKQ